MNGDTDEMSIIYESTMVGKNPLAVLRVATAKRTDFLLSDVVSDDLLSDTFRIPSAAVISFEKWVRIAKKPIPSSRSSITLMEDKTILAGVKLKWSTRPEWEEWAKLTEGTYILCTNIQHWTDQELWKTYIQLSEAEAAFRIQKSDLCIRPIWHHKQNRIKAHILICFLAYVLWKTLQQWQSRAGLGDSPRTILTEFSRIHCADVVLPLADGSKRELRLRCVVRPDREQELLLQRLGLRLPERLRPPVQAPNVVPT